MQGSDAVPSAGVVLAVASCLSALRMSAVVPHQKAGDRAAAYCDDCEPNGDHPLSIG